MPTRRTSHRRRRTAASWIDESRWVTSTACRSSGPDSWERRHHRGRRRGPARAHRSAGCVAGLRAIRADRPPSLDARRLRPDLPGRLPGGHGEHGSTGGDRRTRRAAARAEDRRRWTGGRRHRVSRRRRHQGPSDSPQARGSLSPAAPPAIYVPMDARIDVVGDVDEARAGLYSIDDEGWDTVRLPIDLLEGTPEVPQDPGLRQLAVDINVRTGAGDWRDTTRFFFLIIVFDPYSTLEPPSVEPLPIVVESPDGGAEVTSPITVSGTIDLLGSSVTIRVIDAINNRVGETSLGIDCVTGCRGDFSIEVPYAVGSRQPGEVWIVAEDANGARTYNVRIPVTLSPGADDPIAESLEGEWTDPNGDPVPDGLPGGEPLVLHTFEGADHCGWTSITFFNLSWPVGSEDGPLRQYMRDPMDLFADVPFEPEATLPADATASGYHRGDWELWIADSDGDGIYLVRGDPRGRRDGRAVGAHIADRMRLRGGSDSAGRRRKGQLAAGGVDRPPARVAHRHVDLRALQHVDEPADPRRRTTRQPDSRASGSAGSGSRARRAGARSARADSACSSVSFDPVDHRPLDRRPAVRGDTPRRHRVLERRQRIEVVRWDELRAELIARRVEARPRARPAGARWSDAGCPGTSPTVETVTWRAPSPNACGSVSRAIDAKTCRSFASGSPMPMNTTFVRRCGVVSGRLAPLPAAPTPPAPRSHPPSGCSADPSVRWRRTCSPSRTRTATTRRP